ncbi:MAG: NifU family protein [Bacteroidales bacterium]|nr:NifU family protein [Bacteroidales bacterium]
MIERINVALNQIRPYLNADGGDVLLCDVTDDLIVKVKLTGACGDCPFSLYTLKAGVEEALRKEIPEIREVIAEA